MGTWARTGPVVVEVDGSAEGLRVVDYTVLEAMRSGAELVFAAPFHAHSSYSPMMPAYLPKPPSELADDGLRAAIAHCINGTATAWHSRRCRRKGRG